MPLPPPGQIRAAWHSAEGGRRNLNVLVVQVYPRAFPWLYEDRFRNNGMRFTRNHFRIPRRFTVKSGVIHGDKTSSRFEETSKKTPRREKGLCEVSSDNSERF